MISIQAEPASLLLMCYSGVNIIIGNASLKVRDKINHVTFITMKAK